MTGRKNLRLLTLLALAFLLVIPASSFAGQLLGNHSLLPRIHPVSALPTVNLGFDCAYGSNIEGATFPASVTTSAPYTAPDFDGTLDRTCLATYLGDQDGALHPLVSDNPGGAVLPGAGGGLTIDIVAGLGTSTMSGFDITVNYDPTVLNAVLIEQSGLIWQPGNPGLPMGGFVLTLASTIDHVAGTVRLAEVLVAVPEQTGNSELFRIRFDIVGASTGSPITFSSDVLANPSVIPHNDSNLDTPGVDTTTIYNTLSGTVLGLAVKFVFSPNPEVPGSPLTFTATATCPGCTGLLSYSWDFSSNDAPTYVPKSQSTTNPAIITPPPPVVNRVTLRITDAAASPHSMAITRLLPLVSKQSPSLTTLAVGTASGAWSGQWLGGVTTATSGYTGGWTFCPGSALVRTVCSVPSVAISQAGAGITQTSSPGAETYNFAGLYNATLKVADTPETQIGTSPVGNVALIHFLNNVTGTPAAYTVNVSGNTTSINAGQIINFTASTTYSSTYTSFRSSTFKYNWNFGDGGTATATSGSTSVFIHKFTTPGNFVVTVTATELSSVSVTHIQEVGRVLVNVGGGAFSASVTGPSTGTVNQMLTYNAAPSGGTSPFTFSWAVTGGSPASGTASSFTTSFAAKGTYNVTLTVTDNTGKTAKAFELVSVTPLPLIVGVSGPTTGTVNAAVNFMSSVSGGTAPYSYAWAVSGGSPASGTASTFASTFAAKGTYNVTLTVTDHNGATKTAFQLVSISPLTLTVSISGPTTGSVNALLSFTSTVSGGTSPYTYAWAVTGGSPSAGTASSFSTTFANHGVYNVTLTVTDHNGKTAATFQLVSISAPTLIASINGPTSGNVGQLLGFNAIVSGGTTPYTYAWAVTGGNPSSGTASTFSTTFSVKGTFNVTLTVTDASNTKASAFQLVAISPLVLTASIGGPSSASVNTAVGFTSTVSGGTTPYVYAWAVTGGNPASGIASTFSSTFAVKGTYNVTLTVTDHNGKTASAFHLVTISSTALVVNVGGPTTGAVGASLAFSSTVSGGTSPYTYAWAVTGGNPSSGTASTFSTSFAVKGTYNVTLTVSDHNGAKMTAFQLVTISPSTLTASVTGPTSGTVNQMLTFNPVVSDGTAPYTYAWAVTGGSPASGTASGFATSFAVKGTYNVTLTVTDHNAKTASAFQLVAISPLTLTASVSSPGTGAIGSSLIFTAVVSGGTSPYTYAWAVTGGSPASGTASSFTASFAVKGTYNVTLTVTDHNAKAASAFRLVSVSSTALLVTVSGPTSGTVGATLTFTSTVSGGTSPYTYAWAVTGGSPASGTASGFAASFSVKGTYNVTLTVTDHNGAKTTAFQLVAISPLTLTASVSGPASGSVNQMLTFNPVVSGGTTPYSYAWAVTGGSPASSTATSFTTSFAASGMYNVTLTVTDQNAMSASAFQLVTISPVSTTGDFSVSVNPAHLSLFAGVSRNVTIVVHSFNFAGTVTLTVTITPVVANGPSATLSKSTLTLVINSTVISKLRLSTLASTSLGSYVVNVTAASGGISHSASTTLTVKGFTLTATPSSLTVQAGSSGVFQVTLESQSFSGVVHITASAMPITGEGSGLSFSSSNILLTRDGTASATIQFSSEQHTPLGTYTITIDATGHGLTRSSSVNVTVTNSTTLHVHHHSHHQHNHHHHD